MCLLIGSAFGVSSLAGQTVPWANHTHFLCLLFYYLSLFSVFPHCGYYYSVYCIPGVTHSRKQESILSIYLFVFSPLTLIPCAKFVCKNVRKKWSTKKNVQLNRFFFMCLLFYQSNLSWLFLMSIRFLIFKHVINLT